MSEHSDEEIEIEYRIVVIPRRIGDLGMIKMSDHMIEPDIKKANEQRKKIVGSICQDIKRHVENIDTVYVEEIK